jgi:hypothetical protein
MAIQENARSQSVHSEFDHCEQARARSYSEFFKTFLDFRCLPFIFPRQRARVRFQKHRIDSVGFEHVPVTDEKKLVTVSSRNEHRS